jgi:hypothetical protein
MATTTNYGWSTPDDTALVKDGASAIRTLGSSVDTTTKNLNPQTTTGAIAYRSATANVNTALPIGSTGNVLTVVGGVPAWAAPAGGGKVLQVVESSTQTIAQTNSTSFVDTNLSATITPTLATSKVLVMVTQNGCGRFTTAGNKWKIQLLRGATDIGNNGDFGMEGNGTAANRGYTYAINVLDTPATTSAITYKTQIANTNAAGGAEAQVYNSTQSTKSTIVLMEIGV